MIVGACADDHELDLRIREEVVRSAVVFGIRIVDRAVLPSLNSLLIGRRFSTLQESIHLKVGVRDDKRQVEAFGGEAIAHEANFDWYHSVRIAD